MITLLIPTRNRAHTLRRVGESFYTQRLVTEIIFVDDGGGDDSHDVIAHLAQRYPHVATRVIRHEKRQGAAASRIDGYRNATNDYVLYCDDDIYLMPGYAETCLEKMRATGADIVSGRVIHKRSDQTPEAAVAAFGLGTSSEPPFRRLVCEFRPNARFEGDLALPLTNPAILTRRSTLERYGYDPFYSRGNGYREESDFQMNVFVNGGTILMTNAAHGVELSKQENSTGGQRVNRLQQLYWSVFYTAYFYRKYYDRYAERVGLRTPRRAAVAVFAGYRTYMLFVRPVLRLAGNALSRLGRKPASAHRAEAPPFGSRTAEHRE